MCCWVQLTSCTKVPQEGMFHIESANPKIAYPRYDGHDNLSIEAFPNSRACRNPRSRHRSNVWPNPFPDPISSRSDR